MVDAHAIPRRIRGVVDQNAAAGETLCAPGLQAVDLCPGRGVNVRLRCPFRLSALRHVVFGTAGMLLSGGDLTGRSRLPVVKLLVFLVGKVAEAVPLRTTLRVEGNLHG